MISRSPFRPQFVFHWAVLLLGLIAGWLVTGSFQQAGREPASGGARRPTGSAQLISYQPLPEAEGPMCEWVPASASGSLVAAFRQQRAAARSAAADLPPRTVDLSQRKPVRRVQDPYSVFSAVAVDAVNDEVVLIDENLFNILVYDRLANTPPHAKMTEPKRMIGGSKTLIEFNCAVYVDPASGNIYAVNNDSVDHLVVFDRQAKGNVPPTRKLETPHRTFGIAVDEEAQEMFLAVQHAPAVVVYRKHAKDDEAPIRLLQGNRTQLADAHGIAIDTKKQLMYVSNYGNYMDVQTGAPPPPLRRDKPNHHHKPNWPARDLVPFTGKNLPPSITVYPLKASGDTPPLRVIQGPNTQMNYPSLLALDVERQELYVANDMGDSILTFDAGASGDVKPIRVLKGPKTQIKNPTGVYLDTKNDELWVASFGNHTAAVFKRGASGDERPLRVIRSAPADAPGLGLGNPHTVVYDSNREEYLVPN